MKRSTGILVCLCVILPLLAGCRSDAGSSLANAPRADQEKAFRGDPSKAPAAVREMMAHPPTNAQPGNAAPPAPK